MKDIDAISLWYGDEDAVRFDGIGRVFDPQTMATRTIKLPKQRLSDSPLPRDLTDYCCTVSCVDGEVIHSEVTKYSETSSHVKLTVPAGGPTQLHP